MCVLAYIGSKGVVPEDGSFSWRLLSDMNNHHHRQGEGLRKRGRMLIERERGERTNIESGLQLSSNGKVSLEQKSKFFLRYHLQ